MATNSKELWNEFCHRMNVALEGVPLFATNEDLSVQVHEVGKKSRRLLLKRSPEMEQFVISAAEKIVSDWKLPNQVYEGLIYLMFRKYQTWAEALFEKFPIIAPELPKLKEQVYFWTKAWKKEDIGPWEDFGPTNLTFLEYLMIGVASSVYPENVLNKEGQNRG